MTTINTSTLNAYSSSLSVTVKNQEAQAATAVATDDKKTAETDVAAANATGPVEGGSAGGSSSSALDSTIEKIKEQIKQAQKQLAQEQSQLAAAQSGKGTPEEKAQKALSILSQIMATSATLQTLQASLLQLQTQGGVNTTA
ncbi:hypothetical protein SAMN05216593_103229 [Pseudomonas asturiensis]|uniref:FlxA-like protein n=1 Tax=Pseudomonas asturiensis TaxID=1190415 RepID=A0A1M7LPL9_9PSED|nr:hypothetical protein [Pseudomonas asturiensis]SHM80189.1 hypothetical protein SAMN05216593_103229 [Pseudomonas asturiensis]